MPIDPNAALSAPHSTEAVAWNESDVLLYHLAVGAGADPLDAAQLTQATESGDTVVPTFAVVIPTLRATSTPGLSLPGVDIDLRKILHASQRVEIHAPLPRAGRAEVTTGVSALHDKGSAAVVVLDSEGVGEDGRRLWTSSMRIFARGEGGFGGERGPDGPPPPPEREPDLVIETPTLPQQALVYRLLGDRNPLHSDPAVAAAMGFPRPILHGLATFGIVTRAIVDDMLGGDTAAIQAIETRFAGVVFPGETLRTQVWREAGRLAFTVDVVDREDAPALTGGEVVLRAAEEAS
ncbi:MaoC/PaaZ C-terminal domain-containing protein [Microbacterium sp.]|uniref:MaoC/PaaZ C-terminal domain-containing protein n=1 Tax=Microbacterium sp. TaxID=51671 RepID=UPI0037CA3F4F